MARGVRIFFKKNHHPQLAAANGQGHVRGLRKHRRARVVCSCHPGGSKGEEWRAWAPGSNSSSPSYQLCDPKEKKLSCLHSLIWKAPCWIIIVVIKSENTSTAFSTVPGKCHCSRSMAIVTGTALAFLLSWRVWAQWAHLEITGSQPPVFTSEERESLREAGDFPKATGRMLEGGQDWFLTPRPLPLC